MNEAVATQPLVSTGERMVPEGSDARTFWEHVYRYRFASRYVAGKRVLDVACGEGYGTYSLSAAGAKSIVGIDISAEVCEHAKSKYSLDIRCADVTSLPIGDKSIDLIVCFETVEHVPRPDDFLQQCARVLDPHGTLIISTPNRDVYSENGHHNSFHCSEMTRNEFERSISRHFSSFKMYSQQIQTAPWWQLRSLAAIDSPWLNMRGFWRLRRWILPRSLGTGAGAVHVGEHERVNIASAILRQDSILARVFNPYDVRPSSASSDERATYFVAVCVGPKTPR